MRGTVKFFDVSKNFGFIAPEAGGVDVHFKSSGFRHADAQFLTDDTVEYQTKVGKKGPEAFDVHLIARISTPAARPSLTRSPVPDVQVRLSKSHIVPEQVDRRPVCKKCGYHMTPQVVYSGAAAQPVRTVCPYCLETFAEPKQPGCFGVVVIGLSIPVAMFYVANALLS